MSELTPTPEELVEEVSFTVDDATVIPVPIDPTLTHEGEAADAKATGDAIAGVIGNLRINTKAPENNAVTLYAGDIKMSNIEGAQTIVEAVEAIGAKNASSIMYDAENLVTVKDALDGINTTLDSELTTEQIDTIFDNVFGGED